MKKILFVLLAIASVAGVAKAQEIRLGVTAGINAINSASIDKGTFISNLDSKNGSGWFVGVKAQMPLVLGLKADGALLYNKRNYGLNSTKSNLTFSLSSNTIDLPINLSYGVKLQNIEVFVATGPKFSFQTNSDDINISSLASSLNGITDIVKQRSFSTSWTYSVGTRISNFEFSLNYNTGLGRVGEAVLNESKTSLADQQAPSYKLNTLSLQATYFF